MLRGPVDLLPENSTINPPSPSVSQPDFRFSNLRGVRWRIHLGILPSSSSSSSIDHLRRVTADSRRRYAGLRRRLLVDPHISKDGSNSPDHVMDNPLSQNPDSMWGRFFRSAELEKMVDQDLSRLYPEHGSYFQTSGCQVMLRRILLLWCLRNPEFGYRQGMHELLAPLLYVLHVDIDHLSEVRKLYDNHFADKFDGLSFHEDDLAYNFDYKKFQDAMKDDEHGTQGKNANKITSIHELDPEVQTIILLSDAYGAEGELGILLSEKFMEHDGYCMFDALMSGSHTGAVAMADFFSGGTYTGLPPVIEASSALYHLLSKVDSSLHSHLIELGVEPQYFALRWLRVLFGREFALEELLVIWDTIFAADNEKLVKCGDFDEESGFRVLNSHRGAFISALAVAMILHLRSSVLATENATSCLQRLLNFPKNINIEKLIGKAKSLQALALESNINSLPSPSFYGAHGPSKSAITRGHSLSSDGISLRTPPGVVPDSYWEEKWRVLHNEEQLRQGSAGKQIPARKKGWSEKVRLSLSRTESDPSPAKVQSSKNDRKPSTRRNLLEDLSRALGSEESFVNEVLGQNAQNGADNQNLNSTAEESYLSGNNASDENSNSSVFSSPTSHITRENEFEKSSVASNISQDEINDDDLLGNCESFPNFSGESPLPLSDPPEDISPISDGNPGSTGNSMVGFKERKSLSGKFPWFWKFGRNGGEGTSEKENGSDATKSAYVGSNQNNKNNSCTSDGNNNSFVSADQNVMGSLRSLGHSMLENIQVLESAFQHERGQTGPLDNFSKNVLAGKGPVTAMAALTELRKISNLLSEM